MKGVCLKYTQNNYGSKLQALATVKIFEEFGLDYEIIEYNKKTIRFILKTLPRFFNFIFLNDRYDQFQRIIEYKRHPEVEKQINIRQKAFWSFDEPFNSHLSEKYGSYEELKSKCKEKYDCVITCSDQLWSPAALGSGFYNLMFVPEEVTKISWASSFGVSKIPWYQVGRTKKYLNRIEHISMRENRGAEIVEELTGRQVPVLMDPVFVFDKDKWNELIPYEKSEFGDYIFCYFLGSNPQHRAIAKALAEKTGMKIVTLRHLDRYVKQDEEFGDYAPYDVTPKRFLNILRNAAYICTDSFHGTAFSVIFEKKFVVFDRYSDTSANSKNSRISSVCDILGLNDRRYSNQFDIAEVMQRDIDYNKVSQKISQYRENTISYLKKAFEIE
ncbi:MAG: polysaccharide pyruvyl transferase family protein [Ruminococcaceae bacterium]|nr:polysaccharide pyruvyl transferase family protein [Oscillospiraceae bacterium]